MNKSLTELLLAYSSTCQQQEIVKQQMLEFLSNPDCFERSSAEGHFTASALLLDKKGENALLMYHRKLNKWVQLGGHCDGNRDVLAVAIQEASEESGIKDIVPVSREILDLDIHLVPSNGIDLEHFHYDVRFLLKINSDERIQANHESLDLKWFSSDISSLPTSSRTVTRLFEKWNTQWR